MITIDLLDICHVRQVKLNQKVKILNLNVTFVFTHWY